MTLKNRTRTYLALVSTCALAACGGGGGPEIPEGPRGIFTSTNDCVASKLFSPEVCRDTIEVAIRVHRQTAPIYESERICMATEVFCERSFKNEYRPRLLAFLLQTDEAQETKPVVAIPLYPPNSTQVGLRALDDTHYLPKDVTITFSPMASRALMANLNKGGERKKSGMF